MRVFATAFLLFLAEQGDTYDPRHDTLYRAYLLFTIIGVLVALGGVWVIRRQTNHLQSQLELQAVGLRQWVNTRQWRTNVSYEKSRLDIEFEIVNPTPAPIVLLFVTVTTAGGKSESTGFPENAMLIPDNPYRMNIAVDRTPEQRHNYTAPSGLVLGIEDSISYTDALQQKWEQRFRLTPLRPGSYLSV
jgi:hypothetical protein